MNNPKITTTEYILSPRTKTVQYNEQIPAGIGVQGGTQEYQLDLHGFSIKKTPEYDLYYIKTPTGKELIEKTLTGQFKESVLISAIEKYIRLGKTAPEAFKTKATAPRVVKVIKETKNNGKNKDDTAS